MPDKEGKEKLYSISYLFVRSPQGKGVVSTHRFLQPTHHKSPFSFLLFFFILLCAYVSEAFASALMVWPYMFADNCSVTFELAFSFTAMI